MLTIHKKLKLNKIFLDKKKMKNRNKILKIIKVNKKLVICLLFVSIANIIMWHYYQRKIVFVKLAIEINIKNENFMNKIF